VTSAAQVQAAAGQVDRLDILVNNAGVFLADDLSDRAALDRHLAVNLFGTWGVTQAVLPLLTRSQGAIVNNVSIMALAPLPRTPAYSISKAAAFSLTQSLRALLARRGGQGARAPERGPRPGRAVRPEQRGSGGLRWRSGSCRRRSLPWSVQAAERPAARDGRGRCPTR
jgi:NAD(P)-dependent dehydrogenase (short-subunit alcohol dehydrogenase family)